MASVTNLKGPLLLLHVVLVSLMSPDLVQAQSSFSPTPAGGSASVFIDGGALYIQSGVTRQGKTSQTFSISLRDSWNTSSPVYTKLPDGLNDNRFPNTLLKDGTTWFGISNKTYVTYNILTGNITWLAPAGGYSDLLGLNAVLDRTTGEVMIPNGLVGTGPLGTSYIRTLYINPDDLSRPSRADALSGIPAGLVRYSLARSESTQKTILFGGMTPSGYSASLFQRSSPNGGWSAITTVGGPSARESACMVPAFNGTKMILFGGSAPGDVPLGDIFIYDVANATWTQGADASPGNARSTHVCAVSGDALIAWGGFSSTAARTPPDEVTAVYNLTSNQWQYKFISPTGEQDLDPISKPSPTVDPGSGSDSAPTSGSGLSTGAIVGCVVVVAVALAALGFVLRRRGPLKRSWIFWNPDQVQDADESNNYIVQLEKVEVPQIGPSEEPIPQLENGARSPQLDRLKREGELATEMQLLKMEGENARPLAQA